MRIRIPLLALAAALAVGASACDSTTTSPDNTSTDKPATLKILLTDAAADYFASANVDIGEVQLLPVDGAPITVTDDGTDGMVDLLELQNGATAQLANASIPPGEYKQLRLIVQGASVELADPYTFRDGSTTMSLEVPSGAQTGIKLNLQTAGSDGSGVMIVPGETVLVLDFDVNQSFRIQGNPETPAGIKSVHFQPTLRVTARDVAGSIAGTVSGAADSIDVEGLTVTAAPLGPSTVPGYQTTTATALTDASGAYLLPFLVPGEYEVTVETPDGFFTQPLSADVTVDESADVTGVDFLIDERGSISGTVTAAADSIPVSDLEVTATNVDHPEIVVTAPTDSDGVYTLGDVIPGDYTVTVAVPEAFATTPESAAVTVGAGEAVADVDFNVDEAGSGG